MKSKKIRQAFIDFFIDKQHHYVSAVPITVKNNPSLLFVNAGMNPFTSILLGETQPVFPRVVNSQPCLRVTGKHNDLEEVGYDTYHHTMFEMLGNWSFGDYLQEEAIAWAWELLTGVYGLPKDRLYATVFEGDVTEEVMLDSKSLNVWKNFLPADHIVHGSGKDNFWEMGKTGPCGPCTEIHIDLRSNRERGKLPGEKLVNRGHSQVIEIWNLVFIVYQRMANGGLVPLKTQHVDTGMGLERLVMALQGKTSTYDTDLFVPLIDWLKDRVGIAVGDERVVRAMRVIADHIRAIFFAIADGERPGTQKASYVLRRIMRRAIRYGFSYLHFTEPFLHEMVSILVSVYDGVYPQLDAQLSFVQQMIYQEEVTFLQTLSSGLKRLHSIVENLSEGDCCIAGDDVFSLYDTFGFPPDLTGMIVQEKGYTIDRAGFSKAMKIQKERGKKATEQLVGDWVMVSKGDHSHFVGYDTLCTMSQVVKYRTLQKESATLYQLILNQTPFYAEGGGQVGDKGALVWSTETVAVLDTQKEHDVIIHYVDKIPSCIDMWCEAMVDERFRKRVASNHTTAHLLGGALRKVLGDHVVQKGSLVDDKVCRLDFAHTSKLTGEELERVNGIINGKIRENIPLEEHRNMPIEEAKAMGAIALFTEKYGDEVRVVIFDPNFSIELCGGTHVRSTGEIGLAHVMSESSVGAGIRRIEIVTGEVAQVYVYKTLAQFKEISLLLRNAQDPVQATQMLLEDHKKLRKTLEGMQEKELASLVGGLLGNFATVSGGSVLVERVEVQDVASLRKITFSLQKQVANSIVVLASVMQRHVYITMGVDVRWVQKISALEALQKVASFVDGKCHGKVGFAMLVGVDYKGVDRALKGLHDYLQAVCV